MTCSKWSLFLERIPGIFTLSLESHWKHISSQLSNICFFWQSEQMRAIFTLTLNSMDICVRIKSNDFYSTRQSSFWIVFTFCSKSSLRFLKSLWSTCLIAFVMESITMPMKDGSNFQIEDTLNQFHLRQSFIDNLL
jgi:hypothetical protein